MFLLEFKRSAFLQAFDIVVILDWKSNYSWKKGRQRKIKWIHNRVRGLNDQKKEKQEVRS